MHWAVHGQTAAEVISARADSTKPNMGLSSWTGERLRKADVSIAKNYLDHDELEALNRIVTAYLEFAELQVTNRKPMHMKDWIAKLDEFLRISEREILTHAGKVSHDNAVAKAELEYDRFAEERRALPSPVEKHFEEAVHEVKQIEKEHPSRKLGARKGEAKRTPKSKGKKKR